MVTDQQVRKLMKLIQSDMTLAVAAAKAGMDEKTARKYRDLEKLWNNAIIVSSGLWNKRSFCETAEILTAVGTMMISSGSYFDNSTVADKRG